MKNNDVNTKNNKSKKKKKDAVKCTIESPFNLNLPSLDFGIYSDIVSTLNRSFDAYVQKVKMEEAGDADTSAPRNIKNVTKRLVVKAFPHCVVFGYNSVMRGLEKGTIKSVLVKAEAMPSFLIKAFIPVCQLKKIPLIPVKNLSQTFHKHISTKSVLAVGFTATACQGNGPFRDLFLKCCKALGYEEEEPQTANKPSEAQVKARMPLRVPQGDVNSHYLKRESRSYRVFKPPKKDGGHSFSFIKIGEKKESHPQPKVAQSSKEENFRVALSEPSFFLDLEGVEEVQKAVYRPKSKKGASASRYFGSLDSSSDCTKRKESFYCPTKIKRIKGNPKRHS